jgi:hypothetical protein
LTVPARFCLSEDGTIAQNFPKFFIILVSDDAHGRIPVGATPAFAHAAAQACCINATLRGLRAAMNSKGFS